MRAVDSNDEEVNNEKENDYYIIENADGKLLINKHQHHHTLQQPPSSVGEGSPEGEEEDYILPVSLLDGGSVMESMLASNQTIVLIQVPRSGPD